MLRGETTIRVKISLFHGDTIKYLAKLSSCSFPSLFFHLSIGKKIECTDLTISQLKLNAILIKMDETPSRLLCCKQYIS